MKAPTSSWLIWVLPLLSLRLIVAELRIKQCSASGYYPIIDTDDTAFCSVDAVYDKSGYPLKNEINFVNLTAWINDVIEIEEDKELVQILIRLEMQWYDPRIKSKPQNEERDWYELR